MTGRVLFLFISIILSGYPQCSGLEESWLKMHHNKAVPYSDNSGTSEVLTVKEMHELEVEQTAMWNESFRSKRSVLSNEQVLLSGEALDIRLVRLTHPGHRVKRLTFNTTKFTWTHRIPYIITFTDASRRLRLRKVLDHIEDHLCVKFIDVQATRDPSDPKWLTKNGFKTNAYINFMNGKGCVARYGRGNGRGAQDVSPCYAFLSMRHETMHALGGLHDQKYPDREKYITVHMNNIIEGKVSQYRKAMIPSRLNALYFDPHSNILYGDTFFSKNKETKKTYDFLRPEMGNLYGGRSIKTLLLEMNQNYKCRETFCSKVNMDCGPGYLTFVHDKCVCVCPDMYNPDNNCATLIEKVEGPQSWPNTPFSLYKADQCPSGFSPGTIPISGKTAPEQTGIPLASLGNTLFIEVCTKTGPVEDIAWNDWPFGSMCVGKIKGVPCGLPFVQSVFKIKVNRLERLEGSVGDVTIDGTNVNIKFCCYKDASSQLPAKLPTSTPFRLLKTKNGCQQVDGMFPVTTKIQTRTKTVVDGFKPAVNIVSNIFTHQSCHYIPPVYGCNKIFRLNSNLRKATFSIPNKESLRAGSRRCFYAFQAPKKSRLRLTFNKFSIHPEDRLLVKRFHPWTNPFRVMYNSRPTQIITERNYLFVEFWSYYEEDSQYKGVDMSVDLLLDAEMCYRADLQGSDYAGKKIVSELYEACVPWKEAVTCPDFPWKYSITLLNSGKTCRNLDNVEMLQPWCYTKVQDGACVRRYCDVCNEAQPKDVNDQCADEIAANPSACTDITFRYKCFKSCRVSTAPYDVSKVKCPKPKTQKTLRYRRGLKNSYSVGSSVDVFCGRRKTKITCTTHGWSPFDVGCAAAACIDRSQVCQQTLKNFPAFCTHQKSKLLARIFCKKSCSACTPCVSSDTSCSSPDTQASTKDRGSLLHPSSVLLIISGLQSWKCHIGQPEMNACIFLIMTAIVFLQVSTPYIRDAFLSLL